MARPNKDRDEILEIARMRHDQGLTQIEIAAALGVSEATVSRAIKQAFSLGILEIRVAPAGWRENAMEAALKQRFGLHEAIIVDQSEGSDGDLSQAVAAYLQEIITDTTILGVSDGDSIASVAAAMRRIRKANVEVVSLIGGIGAPQISTHSAEITRLLASNMGARAWQMPAPALVDSREIALLLRQSQALGEIFDHMKAADIALVGIGNMTPSASIFRHGTIPGSAIDVLVEAGAVGSICGRFYDANGAAIPSDVDGRTLAISLDELHPVAVRIGVATGEHKRDAILAALRGGLVNILATNHTTASALLDA